MPPNTTSYRVAILFTIGLAGCMGFGDQDPNESPTITYAEHVQPLLEEKCLDCHGDPPIGGTITISDEAAAISHSARIHARAVIMGDMPPGAPLAYEEKLILDSWIRGVVSGADHDHSDHEHSEQEHSEGGDDDEGASDAGIDEEGDMGVPAIEPGGVTWNNFVGPLFQMQCTGCHGENSPQSDLSLTSFEGLEVGGLQGTLLDTVNVENALLIDYLRGRNNRLVMPPSGAMPNADIELVESWLMNGAPQGEDP